MNDPKKISDLVAVKFWCPLITASVCTVLVMWIIHSEC